MSDSPQSIHKIRLAGPWEVESELAFSEQGNGTGNRQNVKMPASWQEIFGSQRGTAIFRRSFNSPTGLQDQKIFLVIPSTNGFGQLYLNDHHLGGFHDDYDAEHLTLFEKKFEVTQIIQPHNHLRIELECDCEPVPQKTYGLSSAVLLEIIESTPI